MEQSTTKAPIYFFERYLNNDGIRLLKNKFYDEYLDHEVNCTVNYENESVTFYLNAYDAETGKHIDGWETIYFQDVLKRQLNKELSKSKKLIRESITITINPKAFLDIQLEELLRIKNESLSILEIYTFCENVIDNLIEYLNRKLNIKVHDNKATLFLETPSLIINLFTFLGENNYMEAMDYQSLLEYLTFLIRNLELPIIKHKLPFPKISKEAFYLLFSMLNKRSTEQLRLKLLSEFIINVFEGFENRKALNLLKKISDSQDIKSNRLPLGFPQ